MRIGGLIKQSLIDWEGRVTAVIFTQGAISGAVIVTIPPLSYRNFLRKNQKWTEAEPIFVFVQTPPMVGRSCYLRRRTNPST